ncbi:type II secretion system GspH family protein [Marinobacter bryozoorum]|uniref:GspH/FimT family protein n=1 Tax=Marinobacter bryozoorum TaxID=256324 RepID=UPI0020066BA3|nr:GspH/FimT family protein [Marinobacter bryozoorum]MCK7544288.1 type II secretion system GspH family protein [Marinobacter bryozoorum]
MAIQARSGVDGFTLIELVTVIVLVGALSLLGIGLFARESSFSPLLAAQQLESATLLAQQAALAGNPDRFLSIDQDAPEDLFIFRVHDNDPNTNTVSEFSLRRGGATVTITVNGTPIPLPAAIEFNKMGAPAPSVDRTIDISGDSSIRLCLNRLGALYRVSTSESCQ